MSAVDKDFVLNVLRRMFTDVVSASLCESAGESITFVLESRLGGDPFEVLWERPKAVYDELKKVFGEGTNVLFGLLVKEFRRRAETNMDPEKFLQLLCRSDPQAVEEVRRMLKELATVYYEACKKSGGEE